MIEWLIKFIQAEINLFTSSKLKKRGEITKEEIKELFKENSKTINLPPFQLYVIDQKYSTANFEDLKSFLFKDLTDASTYKKEINDCDDFAIKLWAKVKKSNPTFAFGFAVSSSHAFNIFIDDKKKIWIVEPQTDKIFEYKKQSKYKLKMVII